MQGFQRQRHLPAQLRSRIWATAATSAESISPSPSVNLTAVMVAAALALAGCGGGGGTTTTGNGGTTTTGEKTPAQLAAAAKTALDAAKAAVDMVTVSADRARVTDADAAVEKARAAVAAASGADSHAALSQRLRTLETSLASGKAKRVTALETASTALKTALTALEPKGTGSTVAQFDKAIEALAALEKAVADAADLTDAQKKVYKDAVASAKDRSLGTRRTTASIAFGRALHAAMGPADGTAAPVNALNNLAAVPYQPGLIRNRNSLEIDPAAGAGSFATAADHAPVNFFEAHAKAEPRVAKTGVKPTVTTVVAHDSHEMGVGQERYVTRYEKSSDRALVYNDRVGGPLQRVAFPALEWDAAEFFKANPYQSRIIGSKPATTSQYDPDTRKLELSVFAVDTAVDAAIFRERTAGVGSVSLTPAAGASPSDPKLIMIPGTYLRAEGNYFCPSSGTCDVSVGAAGPGVGNFSLTADWYFVHDKGAKVKAYDSSYMYFGWWVRNGANGMPGAVSAFYRAAGGGIDLAAAGTTFSGSATYEGPAVGQYAIHDPLNGKGDGGEFTATARLKAVFGTTTLNADSGMTGTIDRFRLEGRPDPNWSVSLNKSDWNTGSTSDSTTAQVGHTTSTATTTWEIGGVKGAPAGSWVASLYDESSGTVAQGRDGSNHPTSAMGKWQAGHSGTHRMVGAFGARLQPPAAE